MIDFKSLGVAFGGMAMVAGLSYLSKRSSGAKAEVSRKYVTMNNVRGKRRREYEELESMGTSEGKMDALERQWSKVRRDPFPLKSLPENRQKEFISAVFRSDNKDCVVTGGDIARLSERLDIADPQKLADAVHFAWTQFCVVERLGDSCFTDQEVDRALDIAKMAHKKGFSTSDALNKGFHAANQKAKLRTNKGRRPEERDAEHILAPSHARSLDYLDDDEAIAAMLDLEKALPPRRSWADTPSSLYGDLLCQDPGVDPKECARIITRLREALQEVPNLQENLSGGGADQNRATEDLYRDLSCVLKEGRDDVYREYRKRVREKVRKALPERVGENLGRSKLSDLADVFRAADGLSGYNRERIEAIDAASKLPGDTRNRVFAALTADNMTISPAFWAFSRPLAPSYPDLHRSDAARVTRGERIQDVFDPAPIEFARSYWKGPTDMSGSSLSVRRRYFEKKCPDFRDEYTRNNLIGIALNVPHVQRWLDSMCSEKDKSRFDAFVTERKFPAAPGETHKSTYLKEIVNLFGAYANLRKHGIEPKSSPETVERSLRAEKARQDLAAYERLSGFGEGPIPGWWPEDTVAELDAKGEHLRLLRTCRDIVREGIELDHCTKVPENYCPEVASGDSVLVSMRLDPQFDEKGALRAKSHRSTLEFNQGFARLPFLKQHHGYRNMEVENPRALAVRGALLAGIRRAIEREG